VLEHRGGRAGGPCPSRRSSCSTTFARRWPQTDTTRACDEVLSGALGEPWHLRNGLILNGSRVFLTRTSPLLPTVLLLAHGVGHEGIHKTLQQLS
jgi:hypothetical protein